jgi:hypothetical protein
MMCGMKTLARMLLIGCLTLTQAPPAIANPNPDTQLLQQFATCAGRFSALMEHQWLTDGPASDQTAQQRAAMLSLVDAMLDPHDATRAMHWRITAKVAQAALLSRAHFAQDAIAARQSDALLQGCRDLIGQS